jgi:fermentation-respiration switch protein FrsA (DUF1100 family)
VVWAGVACATIAVAVVFFEESLIFFPSRYPTGFWDTEQLERRSGHSIDDHYFETDDGHRLHAWWCRPSGDDDPSGDMLLLWFHGNAGNLSDRADLMLQLARIPAQVFIVDYRGYGRSEGKPNEQGLYRDATASWRYLVDEKAFEPKRIILFGVSLGAAVAVDLATRVDPAGLIVESAFTSVPDMAAHHYRIVPGVLIRTRMDSLSKIAMVRAPKLHIHSRSDEIAPFALGHRLFEAAPGPKRLFELEGAGHNETYLVGGAAYFDAMRSFVRECRSSAR